MDNDPFDSSKPYYNTSEAKSARDSSMKAVIDPIDPTVAVQQETPSTQKADGYYAIIGMIAFAFQFLPWVIYVVSIFQAFGDHASMISKILTFIPYLGQFLWFGSMWTRHGFFNTFTYLVILYGAMYAFIVMVVNKGQKEEPAP